MGVESDIWNASFLKFTVGFLAILVFAFLLLVVFGTFQDRTDAVENGTPAAAVQSEPHLIGY